jgi:hypothetical protein
LAERVGFVPDEPPSLNGLAGSEPPETARSTRNLSIRYKTGTAQSASSLLKNAGPGANLTARAAYAVVAVALICVTRRATSFKTLF